MNVVPAPTAPAHADHGHDHHGHAHHGHAHKHSGHHHAHHTATGPTGETAAPATSILPRFSLIALSGAQRLVLALPAIAALWLLTFWAMQNG